MNPKPKPTPSPSLLRPPTPPASTPPKEVKGQRPPAAVPPPFPPSPMATSAVAVAASHPEAIIKARPVIQITPGEEHLAVYEAERVLAETGLF